MCIRDRDGTVRTLKNAQVIFHKDSSYHIVKESEVMVVGRNDFSAKGNYYYKMNNGTSEKIAVADIGVNNPYKGQVVPELSLIHISRAHETVLDLVCRLLLEKKKDTPMLTCIAIIVNSTTYSNHP